MNDINARFLRELEARGGEIVEELGADTFRVRLAQGEAIISLDNLRRDVERDGDLDAVADFVAAFSKAPRGLPDWPEAKQGLRWALETGAVDLSANVHEKTTRQLASVLCYADAHEQLITLLDVSQVEGWGIDVEAAKRFALSNMDELLAATQIEVDEVRGAPLGMLATHSVFKASLLLAPSLKQRVEQTLGWPLLAVAPCRDFAYLFADESLIGPMAGTVVREHNHSGYPLTTEVLRISDQGIEAIGAFGPSPE